MTKKPVEPPESPVHAMLALVFRQANTGTGHSWERLNHAMHNALQLAIGSGFPFTPDDLRAVCREFRGGYWMSSSDEWVYAYAIRQANTSAIKAYEEYKPREPFIADEVEVVSYYGGRHTHGDRGKQSKERLHVGAKFTWHGEKVEVTSFNDDGCSLVACSYKDRQLNKDGYEIGNRKIKKRYTITRQDIIEDRAERKERAGLQEELFEISQKLEQAPIILMKEMGVTAEDGREAMAEFARIKVKKIRDVLDKARSGMEAA